MISARKEWELFVFLYFQNLHFFFHIVREFLFFMSFLICFCLILWNVCRATSWITEVNGVPIKDLDSFLDIVLQLKDKTNIR